MIKALKDYEGDIIYLINIGHFVRTEFEKNTSLMKNSLNNGLLETILRKIQKLKLDENLSGFLHIIKNILELNGTDEFANSANLIEILTSDEFILEKSCADIALDCVSILLAYQDKSCHLKFKKLLDSNGSWFIVQKLFRCLQTCLDDINPRLRSAQIKFAQSGIFKSLQNKLMSSINLDEEAALVM